MAATTTIAGPAADAARASRRSVAISWAPLLAITLLAATLRLWSFDRVRGNPYYDAAVRSMGLSWHNFFFGAFEPGGQVAIDKTPFDLWLQVAAVKLFGFSGAAVRVPEVVAAIVAVPLLYDLVRRVFGRTAGLGAAAALAVLPTAVLTAHSDTMDSVMMALDVLAAWLVVVAGQTRRIWPIAAAGAVLGLAFNVKLFEGLIVLPALALLVVLVMSPPLRRKAEALAVGLGAFAAVSLSWIVAASQTPLAGRPWPIGSTDGSIWSVVFGFNGIDRLRAPASAAALRLDPPGPLRLLATSGHGYAATIGTMLIAAALLGTAAVVVALTARRRACASQRLRTATGMFVVVWLATGTALTSHMQRLQPRYLETITPAIAAAIGIGVATLATAATARRLAAAALAGAVTLSAGLAVALTHPPLWTCMAAGAAVAVCVALLGARRRPEWAAIAAFGAVLAVPMVAATTVAAQHRSDAGLPSSMSAAELARLSAFLRAHQAGARYELASPTVSRAAPLIVRDGRPVLMLTSLHGRPLVDVGELSRLVASGQVRYALLGRSGCPGVARGRPCPPAVRWTVAHSSDVSRAAGLPARTLYRLAP
jgi:4-amino-4-deoxy-L-arabinose transferase-like glycosyltransferase